MRSASVSQALRSLSPAHREVLNETYFCNRSVNEAARLLGLPVDTVKARVYEALHALRTNMRHMDQTGHPVPAGRPQAQAQAHSPTGPAGRHRTTAPSPWPAMPSRSYADRRG